MFSSFTKIFQSPSPPSDPPQVLETSENGLDKGKQRAAYASGSHSALSSGNNSSAQLPPHPLLRTPSYPSSLALDTFGNGPSHVSWLTGTNTPSATGSGSPSMSPAPSRPVLKPSTSIDSTIASTPNGERVMYRDGIWRFPHTVANAVLGNGGNGETNRRISGGRLSADSGSLHLQSVYISDGDTNSIISSTGAGAAGAPGGSRPLSPIDEAAHSQGQSPSESTQQGTVGKDETDDASRPICDPFATPIQPLNPSLNPFATPVHTPTRAFLTRPLKRSISQTSTSTTTGTFLTPTSVIPPSAISTNTAHTFAHSQTPLPPTPSSGRSSGSQTPVSYVGGNSVIGNQTSDATPRVAPKNPPIDVRPVISNPLPLSFPYPLPVYPGTRRTQLAAPPSLPTVLGSPQLRSQPLPPIGSSGTMNHHTHVSVIYEYEDSVAPSHTHRDSAGRWRDSGRSVSFVTAPSVHFSEPEYDEDDEEEEGGHDDYRQSIATGERDVADRQSLVSEDMEYSNEQEDEGYKSYLARYKAAVGDPGTLAISETNGDLGDSRSHMSLPEGYCDVELGPPASVSHPYPPHADESTQLSRPTSWMSHGALHGDDNNDEDEYDTRTIATHPPSLGEDDDDSAFMGGSILETMSQQSGRTGGTDSDATMVEQAIHRRWLQGVSWGSFRSFRISLYIATRGRRSFLQREQAKVQQRGEKIDLENGFDKPKWRPFASDPSAACVLFFLGFIAPWCWLIGGWLLSERNGHIKESEGQFVETVDRRAVWWPRRLPKPGMQTVNARRWNPLARLRNKSVKDAESGFGGRPTDENMHETTPMTPVDTSMDDSRASVNPVYSFRLSPSPQQGSGTMQGSDDGGIEMQVVDRWVSRCRIAAVTSGVLLCIAVIVVCVVVVKVR